MARPSKWEDRFVHLAGCATKLGATDREVAEMLGVSERTLNNWKIEHQELSEALKLGKEAADQRVEQSLYQKALGYAHDAVKIFADPKTGAEHVVQYTERYPPDTTAMIFWLKNRKPAEWRDRQELTGADGKDLIPDQTVTDEERARRIAFALAEGLDKSRLAKAH